ncbi:MAG: VOC family protein [Opitutus sp.]
MKTRTLTLSVPADRDTVFGFLARLENLPLWAPGLCRELHPAGAYWRGLTPGGEACFAMLADERTAVIDLFLGSQPDEMAVIPFRILNRPHGSAIVCTFFQPADWLDEMYDLYYNILLVALRGLQERFGGGELSAPTVNSAFYPGLVTARFYETWDFYTVQLGFRTVCATDHYVQLSHVAGAQIGILQHELDGPTPELVSATDGRGYWLNLDVSDADAEHARLRAAGVQIVAPLEDKPWGDRQFVVRDPNGVLIAIAHRIEARGTESRPLAVN